MSVKKQPLNGKRVSKPSLPNSRDNTNAAPTILHRKLATIFDQFQKMDDPQTHKQARQDFIFHMTDWLADLQKLAEFMQYPEKFDKQTAANIVAGFLYHVIPHLKAAGRLMLDYTPQDFFAEIDAKN